MGEMLAQDWEEYATCLANAQYVMKHQESNIMTQRQTSLFQRIEYSVFIYRTPELVKVVGDIVTSTRCDFSIPARVVFARDTR